MFQVRSAALRHVGKKRTNNEDFVTFFEPGNIEEVQTYGCLYIVADGVGGASSGEKASRYAAQKVLSDYFTNSDIEAGARLARSMRQAGNEIYDHAEQSERFMRMATTLVAAAVIDNELIVANVGDSRAYLIRKGSVTQLTRDHSFVGEMVRDGVMSEDEAMHARGKNKITRSIGGERDVRVDVFDHIELQPGDKILLCSDGLTRYASRQNLVDLTANGQPQEIVQNLINFANRAGGADNISVVFVEIGEALSAEDFTATRKLPPQAVDWESMDTQSGERLKPSKLRLNHKRKKIRLAALSIALVIVISSLLYLGFTTALKLFPASPGGMDETDAPQVTDIVTDPSELEAPLSTSSEEQEQGGYKDSIFPAQPAIVTPASETTLSAQVIRNTAIREEPVKNSKLKLSVSKNEMVTVFEINDAGDWVHVRYEGDVGWIRTKDLLIEGDISVLEIYSK